MKQKAKQPRKKICKNPKCGKKFSPYNSMQTGCCIGCAIVIGQIKAAEKSEKQAKKTKREDKERLKTKAQHTSEAQSAVNLFIRMRDKGKPCISCDKPDDGSHQRHASHYRSVGACSSLRFNTKNIWVSCAQCNNIKSGNLIEFRIRLEKKHPGLPEWLESQNRVSRYEVDYLVRIKKIFRKRARIYHKLRRIKNEARV
jgi:hypothetical protein